MVYPADPVRPCEQIKLLDKINEIHIFAVKCCRDALFERNLDFFRFIWGLISRLSPRVRVFGRCKPRVLEVFTFNGLAPHVAVDGVDALVISDFAEFQTGSVGELFLFVTGHAPLAGGCDYPERVAVRGQSHDAGVESDLVVAFAGTSVRDGNGTDLAGRFDEFLGHQRTTECGREGVHRFVHRSGFEAGHDEVLGEFVLNVPNEGIDGASGCCSLSNAFKLWSAADIDGERYDVEVVVVTDPDDGDGGVHPAAVSKYALVSGH